MSGITVGGLKVLSPTTDSNKPHVLGFSTARTVADDTLFEAWNDDVGTAIKAKLDFEGRWSVKDGTVAKPSLRFIDDPDSGLYRIGANNVGLAVAGAKVLDVATTGLTVTGTLTSTGAIQGTALTLTGTALTVANGGTGLSSYTAGDTVYYASSTTLTKVAIGGAGTFTRSSGTAPAWSTATIPDTATRGAVLIASASNVWTAYAVGTVGKILRSDGTDLVYTTATFANTYAQGDLLYASAANVVAGLTVGGSNSVLTSNGTVPGWTSGLTDSHISASAEIAVSKLADGSARQLLQTDAGGTGVEWASNIDVPGTLDVTGAAVFDSTLTVTGAARFNGNIALDNAVLGQVAVYVAEGVSLTGSTNAYGVYSFATAASDVTDSLSAFYARIATAAAAFTVTDAYAFRAVDAQKGAGSTITTQYGLYVEALTAGATNYAIYTNAGLVRLGGAVTCISSLEIDGALDHDGTTVGFYGTAPIVKQTGVAETAAALRTALINLGLVAA